MGVTVVAGPAKAAVGHKGGSREGTRKAPGSGSGSEGSSGGGVGIAKSVHQNWCISCQNWYIKGLDSASCCS